MKLPPAARRALHIDTEFFASLVNRSQVLNIPDQLMRYIKGPLLDAREIDRQVLWARLSAVHELCNSERETVRARVHGTVERGLLVTLFGLRGFVPISHVPRKQVSENDADGHRPGWLNEDDLKARARLWTTIHGLEPSAPRSLRVQSKRA